MSGSEDGAAVHVRAPVEEELIAKAPGLPLRRRRYLAAVADQPGHRLEFGRRALARWI